MAFLHPTFLFLHVATAAAWFGLSLRLGGHARLAASGVHEVAEDGKHTVRLLNIFMLLTFIFSMGALMLGGGYPGQMQYHIASVLIVVLLVLQYAFIRPAWGRLVVHVAAGENADSIARRIQMFIGIGHFIWLLLLVLMFWNRFGSVL